VSATRHSGLAERFGAVVVVGSQGALRSFQLLLDRLPTSFPAAIIFDLHRSEGCGVLEQLLARRSQLDVRPAAEGVALEPSTVYIAPHDRQLTLSGEGLMHISRPAGGRGHRFADPLLISTANALGPGLIAVVLSGRLNGGADGVRQVKRRGGRVLVEDPRTAAAPSMPNAALATGCVDFALSPQTLGDALIAMCAAVGAAELFRVRLNTAVAS
jgi:two-component system chemotaxis response regulator CheB